MYSIDPTGDYRVLHSFSPTVDGSGPGPDLLEASDGNLYGVTRGIATLFRIDSSGSLTTLQSLTGTSPGELIQGADGHLYGPTAGGGPDGGGTIIRLDLAGTLTTVYQFARGEDASTTERRDPGTQRPVLWDNQSAATFRGRRQGPCSRWMPRAHARHCTRSNALLRRGHRSTAHRCRTCSRAPTEACTEPRSTCLDTRLFTPGQIFKISPAGDFTTVSSAYWLRAGVIQARDGRLYGTSSGGAVSRAARHSGVVFRVEANGTAHSSPPSSTAR